MTTLVVGCGYLGFRVAARLLERGDRVLGTTRDAGRAERLAAVGIVPIVFDVLASESHTLPTFDRVIYCVGYDRTSGIPVRDVYLNGLVRFLALLRGRDIPFVYASSTGVYGQDDGSSVSEDDATEPKSEAGRVILQAESLARARGSRVIRLAGLYGPHRIIRRDTLKEGLPIVGDPSKQINLVHIDDAASATSAALVRGEPGRVYNIADDRPVERRELYSLTAACLGVPPPEFVLPGGDAVPLGAEADRRISNRRMKEELGVCLAYPDVTTGLPASIAAEMLTPRLAR